MAFASGHSTFNARAIAKAFGGELANGQVLCPGPGHSPRDRSLSIKLDPSAPDGFVVYSFAGDDPIRCREYVRERLELTCKPNGKNGIAHPHKSGTTRQAVAQYDYVDETGELLFQVVRFEPKGFGQRKPNGNGEWIWKLGDTRRVLYRLTDLLEAVANEQPIFISEGEKAADELVALGVTATCSPGGAGKWRESYSQSLKDANVVLLPDNDEAGERHMRSVSMSLRGIARRVRILRLDLPARGDAFDWIANGGTVDRLWELIETVPEAETAVPRRSSLLIRCAADIKPEPIDWIWQDRLARGKHTALAGEPGLGKSQVAVDVIATITRGGEWPNGEGIAPRGRVIILSAEDDEADTIVPRLMAAGADLTMVEIIRAVQSEDGKGRRTFNLQTDLQMLEAKIEELGNVLLIDIDPISAYFGKGPDSHKDTDVRNVLAPVSEMAARLRVGILTIAHFNKGGGPIIAKALHKFMGSIAFVAAPRVAFAIMEDPEDNGRRLFLHAKNNLAPPPPGLAFRTEQVQLPTIPGITASRILWSSEIVSITADEAVAARKTSTTAPALEEAKQFLAGLIGPDGTDVKELVAEAKAAGLSWATIRRAKDELGLKSQKAGLTGGWLWKR